MEESQPKLEIDCLEYTYQNYKECVPFELNDSQEQLLQFDPATQQSILTSIEQLSGISLQILQQSIQSFDNIQDELRTEQHDEKINKYQSKFGQIGPFQTQFGKIPKLTNRQSEFVQKHVQNAPKLDQHDLQRTDAKQDQRRRPSADQQNTWAEAEISLLETAVTKFGLQAWQDVAQFVNAQSNCPAKSANQCNQRWNRVSNPALKKGKWTETEDMKLVEACKQSEPKKWVQIAERLGGRTDIQVRYRLLKVGQKFVQQGLLTEEYMP